MNTDTEIIFEKKIVEVAHTFGWKVASFRQAGGKSGGYRTPVKYDGMGYPDLTLIHDTGFIVFAEIKKDRNWSKYTEQQQAWGKTLADAATAINVDLRDASPERVFYRVWRPRDGDEIARILSFGRVQQWTP